MTPSSFSFSLPRPARALLPVALVLALGACASSGGLHPQGQLLDADSLHSAHTLASNDLAVAGFPTSDWWHGFGDAQLDALVAEGLAGHPSLELADARLHQAEAQAGMARAERLPSLSVSGGYTGLRLPESLLGDEMGGSYMGSGQALASFSYGFDLWGGKRAAWEAAVDAVHAAAVDAQAARLKLSSGIVQSYIELDRAWAANDVAEQELERAQKTLQLVRQRREAGVDSDLQVRQAEARIPAAQQQLQAAQQQIDEARTALAALLGKGPDRGLDIQRPQALKAGALQLPGVLPSELIGRRPDIVAARLRVEAAGKQVKVAKTRFYPSLNLTAMAGVAAPSVGELLKSSSTLAFLGPALSLPIFDGGRLRSNLAGADAQYDLAVATYNQNVVDALHDVADQVNAVRSLQQQVQSQQQALDTATAAFELADKRYQAGIGSYLEVLGVQAQLLAAQQGLTTLHARQLLAATRLTLALGGGFEPDATDADNSSSSVSSHS